MFNHKTLAQSFKYSFEGLLHAIKENQNMRIHILIGILVTTVALILKATILEVSILMAMIFFVILAEMINTSIEEMVDLIVAEHRRQAKIAKDVASGMVLVAAVGAVIVGTLILTPYFLRLLG